MSQSRHIIFNTICPDGMGDFSHFEDIMKVLLAKPRFSKIEFIAIVTFKDRDDLTCSSDLNESIYLNVRERLYSLGIRFYYGRYTDHINYSNHHDVQDLLSEADQVVTISYGDITENLYAPYFKKGIPIKYIGEHESIQKQPGRISRSLGLSEGCFGIKIQDIGRIKPKEAYEIIAKNNPEFFSQLLSCTNSDNFDDFISGNIVVPAYFNKPDDFAVFLNFLGVNSSLTQGKNIIVFHSGYNFSAGQSVRVGKLKNTLIKQIELFQAGKPPLTTDTNPQETSALIIKIISGFHVNDQSYDAIYQLSNIAGVSGDNTLERCISMNILPFYRSTNLKAETLSALQNITQSQWLAISPEARKSYNIFFHPNFFDDFQRNIRKKAESFTETTGIPKDQPIDLQAMIDAWPIVAEYLRNHKNFYNHLEDIILEGSPPMSKRIVSLLSLWSSPWTLFQSTSVVTAEKQRTPDKTLDKKG